MNDESAGINDTLNIILVFEAVGTTKEYKDKLPPTWIYSFEKKRVMCLRDEYKEL